ncbi:MAG: AMP-binding protein [Acidimicrobiales bacterium]
MADAVWRRGETSTISGLLEARLDSDPSAEYLDICGTKLSAADVRSKANRLATTFADLGGGQGQRVATLIENSPAALLAWFGAVRGGSIAVPINTAFKGAYLRHQLADSGSRVLVVQRDLLERAAAVIGQLPELEHVVVVDDGSDGVEPDADLERDLQRFTGAAVHRWTAALECADDDPAVTIRPEDLGTFIYTGGTTGPSKGCMLSHAYHAALARQIGICWGRTPEDVVWTPLPLFHFNALTTAVCGALIYGGRAAIDMRFSVSQFWAQMNRTGATITSTLGTMAYLLAHDIERPEMPSSGRAEANTTLRLIGAAPLPVEVDTVLKQRFGVETFSGAYGTTEASLASWQPPGVSNKPDAAGVINAEYFDVRVFDDDDDEVPRGSDGEIVLRPKRPHVMFEGYWGQPEVTVGSSRNWWYHTGDVGRIDDEGYLYFVDRKADYLRRRGENISSFEVESILMAHGSFADVAVHAVPSALSEDDLKVTAVVKEGASVTEEGIFRWCIDQLPYFALPRYIELRDALPRSPVGRVLKRELRAEGVTATTWDAEQSGITYDKR